MAQAKSKPVKFLSSVPAVSTDGHGLGIDPSTGGVGLLFFQLEINQGKEVEKAEFVDANVVANIRLNVDQLEQLSDDIKKQIAAYRKTNPKKTKK